MSAGASDHVIQVGSDDGARGPTRALPMIRAFGEPMYEVLSRGLSFKLTMGNIVHLSPPLTVTREEMDLALAILDEAIGAVEAA